MTHIYDLLQAQAANNKHIYALLRFACRCEHVTSLVMQGYESTVAFLAAKNTPVRVMTLGPVDDAIANQYQKLAQDMQLDVSFQQNAGELEETDLLYIDTPAEGNYRAMELGRYASKVRKYIILPNTVKFAHTASPQIKLADNMSPIGLVHGINHFLQSHDDWFILEHDDLDPGVTVLVNRKNVDNA